MAQPKDQNKIPATDPKEMQIHELPDKEYKKAVIKHHNSQFLKVINDKAQSDKSAQG